MKLLQLDNWGVAARLVAIALVPAVLMVLAVNMSLYWMAQDEVNDDIRERGRLIAAALAESSQYGVISGNVAAVEQAARGLMATERSLVSVKVFDAQRKELVAIGMTPSSDGAQTFEVAVESGALSVNLFDTTGAPHVTFEAQPQPADRSATPAGFVQIAMSPAPLLATKRHRVYLSSALVMLAAMLGAAAGLNIAKRLREPLNGALGALRAIRQGDYEIDLGHHASGELGDLQAAIAEAAKALGASRQELESQVTSRTKELQSAMVLARVADDDRRRLIARGNDLIEEERRRISLEIHDDLNAALISVRLQAMALAAQAGEGGRPDLRQAAERIAAVTDDLYARARNIVNQLRPEVLDTLGLRAGIEEMVRQFDRIHPACRFAVQLDADMPSFSDQASIAIYRVIQEALSNVVKHAEATQCTVVVSKQKEADGVQFSVRDNGRGFDPSVGHAGIGLVGMRERLDSVGGALDIESSITQGTTVTIRLPLAKR